jgi:hypothetical protein
MPFLLGDAGPSDAGIKAHGLDLATTFQVLEGYVRDPPFNRVRPRMVASFFGI